MITRTLLLQKAKSEGHVSAADPRSVSRACTPSSSQFHNNHPVRHTTASPLYLESPCDAPNSPNYRLTQSAASFPSASPQQRIAHTTRHLQIFHDCPSATYSYTAAYCSSKPGDVPLRCARRQDTGCCLWLVRRARRE